ncbi:MAG: ankyrin repeat domain-containing protein, partial [Cyanobacteria bacterium]|nr:ankyrin repeat domain-containing protein [Cyanobacteriota bacterium]
ESELKKYLDRGGNPNQTDGKTTLMNQIFLNYHSGDLLEILLRRGGNPNLREPSDGTPPILSACRNGSGKWVTYLQKLLEAGADVNMKDAKGFNVLMAAFYSTKLETFKYLFTIPGLDFTCKHPQNGTLLDWALQDHSRANYSAATGKIVELMREHIKAFNTPYNTEPVSLVILAAYKGKLKSLEALCGSKADLNSRDRFGKTALMWAAIQGQTEAIKVLVKAGADLNAVDHLGKTALIWAATKGQTHALSTLLGSGADFTLKDVNGRTALHWASAEGYSKALPPLVSAGACIDETDKEGNTPLHLATLFGHYYTVKHLVRSGASLHSKNLFNQLPIDIAKRDGWDAVASLLDKSQHLENVNSVDSYGMTRLMQAAYKGRMDTLNAFIQAKASLDLQDKQGNTALIWAIRQGNLPACQTLLKAGANLNLKDNTGCTALMWAVRQNNTNMVKALLDSALPQKLYLGEVDGQDQSALTWAVKSDLPEILALLLKEREALQSSQATTSENALVRLAASLKRPDCLKLLIQSGLPLEHPDSLGLTPLMLAAKNNRALSVKMLLDAGVERSTHDSKGNTALSWATWNKYSNCIKLLKEPKPLLPLYLSNIDAGTSIATQDLQDRVDSQPLGTEASRGITPQEQGGNPASLTELSEGVISTEKMLQILESGILRNSQDQEPSIALDGVNIQDSLGRTWLHYACKKGSLPLVKALLLAGADPTIKDKMNKTPEMLAQAFGWDECLNALKEHPSKGS